MTMQRRQFHRLLTASVSAASFLSPVLVHAQAKTVLRAGDQKGGLRALLEAAGELKDLSYDIKWTEFPAAAPLAEALNADAVDFGPIGDAPLLFTLAAGSRVKAFAANRSDPYGTAILVTPQSTLKDASSLKGKSIATNRGSIGHYVTLKALEAVGLTADDVQIKFIPPADAKLALTQGAVDAWATWEPYTALAETSKHARVLVSGRGLSSGLSFLAATESALQNKRAVLQDFKARVERAQVWSYQRPAEFGAALARVIGIPEEAARLQFERRATRWLPIDAQVVADQQRTADFYLKVGLVKQKLDVSKTFDSQFSQLA
ncbi:sulfonate transport system substrate-binding protein [Acidovorax sp. 62]|nr:MULTISPECIES: ABC transporter substrate-binding protein [unclassified Acidovorax]AYM95427.1 ABC transporter substrate-binding protein [Acidovorax sp. 1608163]PIF27187.1 sulfonate transport system substrate-binding protein [Acidovorax sp. 56]PIF91756.1 sulfonate transport system substrate-binding protein [Acidovorax sp. 62]